MFCSNMNTQWDPEECVCVWCVCGVWVGGGGGGGGEGRGREGLPCINDFHDSSNIQYHTLLWMS